MRKFLSQECFIISPIGKSKPHDDELKVHVEGVREKIINAALTIVNERQGLKLKASRSDMRPHDGSIKEHFLRAILSDAIIFVVLTYDVRPNVYYEMGIAHSAARPVIVLKDKRIKREFDTYDIKMIDYSLEPADEILPIQAVADHLESILAKDDEEFAFARYDPLNRQNAHLTFHKEFKKITYSDWGKLLNRANRRIDFFGATLLDLASDHNNQWPQVDDDVKSEVSLKRFLAAKILFGGIDVSIVFLHEENLSIDSLLIAGHDGVDAEAIAKIKLQIAESTREWSNFAKRLQNFDQTMLKSYTPPETGIRTVPRRGSFRLIKIRHGAVKFRLTLTDKEVLATPVFYLPGRNSMGPALSVRSGLSLYDFLRDDLDHLKSINEASTEAAVTFPDATRAG